jgi:hypothetical protein
MGVSRKGKDVTIRWKPVAGKYTLIKIKYCQTGTENCANYTVPNPAENYATFFVDVDKTYYYYMLVEDGGDVVYRSMPLVVDDKSTGGKAEHKFVCCNSTDPAKISFRDGELAQQNNMSRVGHVMSSAKH